MEVDQTSCKDFYRTIMEVLLNISVFQYVFDGILFQLFL